VVNGGGTENHRGWGGKDVVIKKNWENGGGDQNSSQSRGGKNGIEVQRSCLPRFKKKKKKGS